MSHERGADQDEALGKLSLLALLSSAQAIPGKSTHQGDEVGEGEAQCDIHFVLLSSHRPKFFVVALFFEQVLDQPLLLI